jgi:trehalose-6-phosphatase
MNIKIIGSKCSNGIKLRKMVSIALEEIDEAKNIDVLDDIKSINKYKINNIPGLVINEKVISQGKVLSVREISKILKEAYAN